MQHLPKGRALCDTQAMHGNDFVSEDRLKKPVMEKNMNDSRPDAWKCLVCCCAMTALITVSVLGICDYIRFIPRASPTAGVQRL